MRAFCPGCCYICFLTSLEVGERRLAREWDAGRVDRVRAGMPNAADMPMLLERPHNDGVELTWSAQSANGSGGPVLYLVGARSNVGRRFDADEMTSWQLLTKVGDRLDCLLRVKIDMID